MLCLNLNKMGKPLEEISKYEKLNIAVGLRIKYLKFYSNLERVSQSFLPTFLEIMNIYLLKKDYESELKKARKKGVEISEQNKKEYGGSLLNYKKVVRDFFFQK